MRKWIGYLLLVAAALSCQTGQLDPLPRYMREQGRFSRYAGQGAPADSTPQKDPLVPPEPDYVPSVYATALHFRDSADWRKDSLLAAEVLFFKDGALLLRQMAPSPADPERHRIWGGHLWTDYTDGHQTVLLCDGEERFRYAGEELLKGFLILNGDVHTLGQHPGQGFCYRINGAEVFSSAKGTILGTPSSPEWRYGAFSLDGEDVYYCYSLPVPLKNRTDREYRIMRGATTFKTIPAGTTNALLDLRVRGGTVYRIDKRNLFPYLVVDETEKQINTPSAQLLSGRLVPLGEGIAALGCSRIQGQGFQQWCYSPEQESLVNLAGSTSDKSCLLMDGERWLLADASADGLLMSLQEGSTRIPLMPGLYSLATPRCLFLSDGWTGAALTRDKGSQHVLYANGSFQSLSFNGYFTSVVIE